MTFFRVVIIALVFAIVQVQSGWCEPAYDRQGDLIHPGAQLWDGVLEHVDVKQNGVLSVIINDTVYFVDRNTLVKNASGKRTKLEEMEPGASIDFYALDQLLTKVMIGSAPKGSNNEVTSESTSTKSDEQTAPIRQEGGVWKN